MKDTPINFLFIVQTGYLWVSTYHW